MSAKKYEKLCQQFSSNAIVNPHREKKNKQIIRMINLKINVKVYENRTSSVQLTNGIN